MDPIQNTAFIDEAERKLRIIRNSILVSRQEGRAAGLNLVAEIGRLRETADQMDLRSVVTVLETIEREVSQSFHPNRALTDAETHAVLDLISHAEAEIIKLRFSHDDTNMVDFIDASFDCLRLGSLDQPDPAAAEPVEEDEFEPDAEMLEIFSMEADDLLGSIESNLEILSASPADREALWEIRRHAHTFKGAAGIIGLKKPSKMAHRIEDLLDELAQDEIVPDARVLELITSATDCLRAITKGDASEGTAARTSAIYKSFDEVMAGLSADAPAEVQPSASAKPEQLTPVSNADEVKPVADASQPRRPIVRVSIARLDNLVRTVRDLVVSRSAVEQRMSDFESQLEALSKTTRRLQAANAKIENDFEASMLGSFMPAPFLRHRSSYRDEIGFAAEKSENEEFDALEFDRYTDFHESSRELSEAIQECFAIGTSLEALKGMLETTIEDQRRLIEETQEKVMQIRLIRFESLVTRLQRAVRVTCEEEHKKAEIVIENQDVELDTDVLDSLVEPLMHLIRNAVVHGIEPPDTRRLLGKPEAGRITVGVANQETHIELKVSDDGRGIAETALRERAIEAGMTDVAEAGSSNSDNLISLLSLRGLTTAEHLTMSAGRGVGMGIVKESVEARNGTVSVETSLQQGTTFTIRVPLAFAVTQALLVRSGHSLAAVPFRAVKRILEIPPADLRHDGPVTSVEIDFTRFSVFRLSDHFSSTAETETSSALLIESREEHFVLIVDEILRTEELAVKPLGKPLDKIAGLLGAAVLGNGEVVPVLDVSYFPKAEPRERTNAPAVAAISPSFVLVVDDSPSVRHLTSKVITAAGWNVTTAKDGAEALEILNGPNLPDVILTDVEMPRMDGYELAAAIKTNDVLRQIPIVFITSRASEKHKERAAELGVSEYLTKPFIESELLNTIERLSAIPAEIFI
jgi:chemosensory pili system protein ChpA (sensor histidine kinase/response regulator)